MPRPLTHDLMKNLLEALDGSVERVEITRVDEGTFFAAITIRAEERTLVVDTASVGLDQRARDPHGRAHLHHQQVLHVEAADPEARSSIRPTKKPSSRRFVTFLDSVEPSDFQLAV